MRVERRRGPDRRRQSGLTVEGTVFARLPLGLIVLNRDGVVLAVNDAARALLLWAPWATGQPMPRCCDLLGCGRGPGPLQDSCFTELVASAELGDDVRIPIERPVGHAASSRSLLARPLSIDGGRILVQLSSDQRDEPPAQPCGGGAPELRITTLGRTRLSWDHETGDDAWLQQRPGEVLQYLICERHRSVPTDEIAEALWPNAGPASINNVRFAVYDLRRRMEPQRPHRSRSAFVISGKGCYRLNTLNVEVDADAFHESVERGMAAFIGGRSAESAACLDHALDLYAGEFLSDLPYATWAMLERARLHAVMIKALRLRAELARNEGDSDGLLEYVAQLGQMEPLDLEIQRQRIETCLSLGRYGEASRCYAELRQRMMSEFGQRPPFELAELVHGDFAVRALS